MALEGQGSLPVALVPDPRLVIYFGRHTLAVRLGTTSRTRPAWRRTEEFPACPRFVPDQHHGLVSGPDARRLAVRAERNAPDHSGMALEAKLPCRLRVHLASPSGRQLDAGRQPIGPADATLAARPAWPLRLNTSLPVAVSGNFTVWSWLADAKHRTAVRAERHALD